MGRRFPSNADGWRIFGAVYAGALFAWVFRPLAWLVMGPTAMLARIAMTLSAESDWGQIRTLPGDTTTVGDDTASIGPMQWHNSNDQMVRGFIPRLFGKGIEAVAAGTADDWRESAFWSGWAYTVQRNRSLVHDLRWLALAIPVFGTAVDRWQHTHGFSKSSASRIFQAGDDGMWHYWRTNLAARRGAEAYWVWRIIGWVLVALFCATPLGPFALFRKKKKKKKKN